MALTYRSKKGSALTIDELDNNFRHFTGSHTITGSVILSDTITAVSGVFGHITASTVDVDADTIRIGGTSFSKDNLDELKSGKPIRQDSPVGGFDSVLRPEVVMSALNTVDYQKWTVENRIGTFMNSTLVHDINFNGGNNYIRIGKDSNTQTSISGSLILKSGSLDVIGEYVNFNDVQFTLSGSTAITGSVIISGSTTISGSVSISGSTTTTGSVTISGSTTIDGPIVITGSTTISGSTIIDGSTVITGSTTISGSVVVTGSLTISGSGTLTNIGPFNQTGFSTFVGNISASGEAGSGTGAISASRLGVNVGISKNGNEETNINFSETNKIRLQTGESIDFLPYSPGIGAASLVSISFPSASSFKGNISASGAITASKGKFTNLSVGGTKFVTVDNNGVLKNSDGLISVILTNKGHISASGAITASTGIFASTQYKVTTIDDDGVRFKSGNGETINIASLNGQISASGAITASKGKFTNLSVGGTKFVTVDNNGVLKNSDGLISVTLAAKGSISASGAITASSFKFSPIATAASQDLNTSTDYSVNGSKVEVRAITAAQINDGDFATFKLLNTSIATNSIVLGSFTGEHSGSAPITGSILTATTIAASTASVFIHNETGANIGADTSFTASFVIL